MKCRQPKERKAEKLQKHWQENKIIFYFSGKLISLIYVPHFLEAAKQIIYSPRIRYKFTEQKNK